MFTGDEILTEQYSILLLYMTKGDRKEVLLVPR